MRASTIRRAIVFGVCALGVGSLYLVPSMARSPDQIGLPPVSDEPTESPAAGPAGQGRQADPTAADRDDRRPDGKRVDPSTSPNTAQPTFSSTQRPGGERRPTRGATAYDTSDGHDEEAPDPVRIDDSPTATHDRLALNWSTATDNVGVVSYKIWLDGFPVATTAETHAELRWFNDGATQHVVQVRAIDAAGNQSVNSPAFIVTRPTPSATPTPSDSPTPESSATQPRPEASPSAGAVTTVSPSPSETH